MSKVKFDNPFALQSGYNFAKRSFGFVLVLTALYFGYKLIDQIITRLSGVTSLEEFSLTRNFIAQSDLKDVRLTMTDPLTGRATEMLIEVPEYVFLFFDLFIAIVAIGIVLRFIIAILNAGINLLRDDVNYVMERIKEEMVKG